MDSFIKPGGISYGEPKYLAFFLSLKGQEIATSTDVELSSSQDLPQGRVVDLVGSTASAKHNQVTIHMGGEFRDVAADDASRYLHRMYSLLISNKHRHLEA
ncbi:hypothetical protein [Pseudomonas hunanensis]|uniref:hypothetical protein n=1 Tax=Pseudomonas hunanensis TaxID=1247546 RepID=UPI003DA1AE32